MQMTSQRVLIWTSIVVSTVYGISLIFLMGFWPFPPSPSLDTAHVLDLYMRHRAQFKFGVVVAVLSSGLYLPFVVAVTAQMARLEKGFPVWAIMQLLAGLMGAWAFSIPSTLWGITQFYLERNPEITFFMNQFSWLFFVTPANFIWLQCIPIAIISFSSANSEKYSAFPRWTGWLTLFQTFCGCAPILALVFNSGPFAWNGVFAFYIPLTTYLVWYLVLSFNMLRAIGYQEREAISQRG